MRPAKLDRETIIRHALALLQEGGLEQVSLRKIAARLDVTAPSLYWYVQDRDGLYAAMSESIFRGCVDAVPDCDDWQGWLRAFGLVLWRAQHEVRDARLLIMTVEMAPAVKQAMVDAVLDRLAAHGLARGIAFTAERSVQALVTGWTTLDRGRATGEADADFLRSLDALIDGWAGVVAGPEAERPRSSPSGKR